jgi:DNA-binding HxlR family transcriptional regulator
MSKKGFYEILNHVIEHENIHYNDVLKHCLEKRIVDSRASITIILNGLTELDLLEREVSQTRPIRTTYKVSKKGKTILKHLKDLEILF